MSGMRAWHEGRAASCRAVPGSAESAGGQASKVEHQYQFFERQGYGSRREEQEEGHHVPLRTLEIQTSLGEQEEGRSRAREAPEGGRPPVPGVLAPDWVEPQDRRVCSVQSLPPAPARGAAGAGWVTHKSKYLCPLLGECLLQQSAVGM